MSNFTENNSIDKENFKSFMSTVLSLAKMRGIWIDGELCLSMNERDKSKPAVKYNWHSKGNRNREKDIAEAFGLSVPELRKIVGNHMKAHRENLVDEVKAAKTDKGMSLAEAAKMLGIDEENAVPIEHAETDTVTESNGISET